VHLKLLKKDVTDFIAVRHLTSRHNKGFVSFITFIAIIGVALGVASLDITLAILGGFEKTIKENVVSFTAHMQLFAFENDLLPDPALTIQKVIARFPDVLEMAPYLSREFKALARTWAPGSPERHSFDRDVERIVSYAAGKIDPAANGVAIFACWGAGEFFEAIQLTTPVSDNRVYAYNQPHLYHLAHLDEQFPRYAAVLTDTNTARIFVFGLGHNLLHPSTGLAGARLAHLASHLLFKVLDALTLVGLGAAEGADFGNGVLGTASLSNDNLLFIEKEVGFRPMTLIPGGKILPRHTCGPRPL